MNMLANEKIKIKAFFRKHPRAMSELKTLEKILRDKDFFENVDYQLITTRLRNHLDNYINLRADIRIGYTQYLKLEKYEHDILQINNSFINCCDLNYFRPEREITFQRAPPWEKNGLVVNIKQFGSWNALALFIFGFDKLYKSNQAAILDKLKELES